MISLMIKGPSLGRALVAPAPVRKVERNDGGSSLVTEVPKVSWRNGTKSVSPTLLTYRPHETPFSDAGKSTPRRRPVGFPRGSAGLAVKRYTWSPWAEFRVKLLLVPPPLRLNPPGRPAHS